MSNKHIRVTGLVKSMRIMQEHLAGGIAPQDADAFRRQVRQIITQVEQLCKQHRITPEALPAPSYRAYRFFKELDLDALPLRHAPAQSTSQPAAVRITNVVAAQTAMNILFAEWAAAQPGSVSRVIEDPILKPLLAMLEKHVSQIEALAQAQAGSPAQLPTPSRRAYQWLKFLCDPVALHIHLDTLRQVLREFSKPHCRTLPPKRARLPVEVEFAYSSHLYRVRIEADVLRVTLHEGFSGAPEAVVRDLICAVLLNDKGQHQQRVRDYAAGEEFLDVLAALELTIADAATITQGRQHDLALAFERVNAAYFAGQLARPRLAWSQTVTTVKLGHYDFLRDMVIISLSLDAAHVPEYVLDFVMYHELLHKQLGVNIINGRRYAHTPEFRAAEQRFAQYTEARAFLERIHTPGPI